MPRYYKKKMPQKNKAVKKRLSQLERKVASNRPEVKQHDIAVTVGSLAVAGHSDYVPAIVEGTGYFERVGNEINMLGFRWRGRLRRDSLDLIKTTSVRLMLFYDLDSKPGVKPLLSEVLQGVDVWTLSRASNRSRFNIVYDRVFTMDKDTREGIPFDTKLLKLKYKQHYDDVGAPDYLGRTLFWAVIPTAATAGELPSIDSTIRMFYVDP